MVYLLVIMKAHSIVRDQSHLLNLSFAEPDVNVSGTSECDGDDSPAGNMVCYLFDPKNNTWTKAKSKANSEDETGDSCTEAVGAFHNAQESVTEEMLMEALKDTRPSVTEKELRKFQAM